MTPAPHPLRCENRDEKGFCSTSCKIRTPILNEDETLLFYTCYHLLASHSSAAGEAEKVLDGIIKSFGLWDCPYESCHHNPGEVECRKCILNYLKSKRKELREQQGERE